MAGIKFFFQTPSIPTGASEITLLQAKSPNTQRVLVWEWSISFDGVSPTAVPIYVHLARQTTAGSGGTNLPAVAENDANEISVQTTALYNINSSTQPSWTAVKMAEFVHPQKGYTWRAPKDSPLVIPGGGYRLGIMVTAPVGVDAIVRMACEE